jgi:hypothetical protein
LKGKVEAEESAEADEPADDQERAEARRAGEGVRDGLEEPGKKGVSCERFCGAWVKLREKTDM